jgi:hypothetical protein
VYYLPVWFLILSLFLPRLALFVEWWNNYPFPFVQPWRGLSWVFFPRLLVLIMIHENQGFSVWFWIHLVVAILALFGGGSAATNRHD